MTAPVTPRVGDPVPALQRTITLTDMVAYAGATWDWHRLHYDQDYAAEKGLPGPVVDGQVFGALLVEQVQDWLGPRSFVRRLDFTFRNLVFAGETVRCEGTVTEATGDRIELALTVVVVGPDGAPGRPAVAPAHASVLLGQPDGPGAR
ncbi:MULTISPECIES: MaoC/PaaZ C-terminal domain-containing protein [unclassified Nocardioides]|uniref:MaoC/PaaZ C-terminal domain-containing protein n=1 Tax=unclassified Nocardioides TaxID=2615069 RepID=UPI000056FF9D|nr:MULTISPECIES: MaoC/PaaZ C-terminal domain-containing protein [unclassified Nocardioides]ABL83567.1 MaoC domain protein dehydratase [Nocardioides sp. JS614]